jgi:hypothetical protein
LINKHKNPIKGGKLVMRSCVSRIGIYHFEFLDDLFSSPKFLGPVD